MDYKRIFCFVAILLLILSLAAFATSLRNGFLIDDDILIRDNILIKNLKFVPILFSRPFLDGYYRPIALISFAFDYFIWKLNPCGYHLTNVLLHFFNSVLLFILLYLLFKDFRLSVLTSALFAVHPIESLRVNYITGRHHLLVVFFMLAALIMFYFSYKKRKIQFYLLGLLSFIAALLSRESAMLFPFYLLCASLVVYKKGEGRHTAILVGLTSSVSLLYLLLRLKYFGLVFSISPNAGSLFSLKSISAFCYIIFRYVFLVAFPQNMYMIYIIDSNAIAGYQGILYILLMIFCILFLLIKFRTNKIVLFASAWFFIGVLPLYNIMLSRPLMGLTMHDAYVYFASIGVLVIFSMALIYLTRLINRKLWFIFISAILLFYISNSNANNALWKNTETYCLYWLKANPKNYIANLSLANYYVENKKVEYYFKQGLDSLGINKDGMLNEVLPNKKRLSMIYNCLGSLSYKQGNLEKAMEYHQRAVKINEKNSDAYFNLGCLYLMRNHRDKAISHFKETTKGNFYHLNAHYNLALIYAEMGNEEKALEEAKIALFLDPQHPPLQLLEK